MNSGTLCEHLGVVNREFLSKQLGLPNYKQSKSYSLLDSQVLESKQQQQLPRVFELFYFFIFYFPVYNGTKFYGLIFT